MKPKSLISVIMPVHNGELHLEDSIKSILNQTYKNFEFIIINDCSSDGTANILNHYSHKDKRINIFDNESNKGITKSLNEGLCFATGKYIARMDVDDISTKNRFEVQIKFLEENSDIAVCGSHVITEKTGYNDKYIPYTPEDIKATLFFMNALTHPSVMMKSSVIIEENNFYNEKYKFAQDYELWCRLSKNHKIVNLKEDLLEYRWHESNVSILKRMEQMNNHFYVKIQMLEDLLERDISEKEKEMHAILTGYSNPEKNIKLNQIEKWTDFLYSTNKEQKTFTPASFKKILNYRLQRVEEKINCFKS
ncbi:MAG TPA: glycosyltransferase [Victivallales bacterium]|nr:glycosyltransferase [Victivallales bacterium]